MRDQGNQGNQGNQGKGLSKHPSFMRTRATSVLAAWLSITTDWMIRENVTARIVNYRMALHYRLILTGSIHQLIHSQHTSRKKESVGPGTEERKKIQAAQLGIEPRASGFAHQCSDHWAITPQPLTTLNIPRPDVYQCQRYTVGWLPCCSLQPTAADTMRCYVMLCTYTAFIF